MIPNKSWISFYQKVDFSKDPDESTSSVRHQANVVWVFSGLGFNVFFFEIDTFYYLIVLSILRQTLEAKLWHDIFRMCESPPTRTTTYHFLVLEVVRSFWSRDFFSKKMMGDPPKRRRHTNVIMTNERERFRVMMEKEDFKADKMLVGWLGGWGSFNISAINILSLWFCFNWAPGFRPFFRLYYARPSWKFPAKLRHGWFQWVQRRALTMPLGDFLLA